MEARSESVLEMAAQAIADGGPLAAVAQWFDVTESELQAWIAKRNTSVEPERSARRLELTAGSRFGANGSGLEVVSDVRIVGTRVVKELPAGEECYAELVDVPNSIPVSEPQAQIPVQDPKPDKPAAASRRPSPVRSRPTVRSSSGTFPTKRRESHPSPMGIRDILQALRRRWLIVIAVFLFAAAAGWMTAPGKVAHATTFQATHTLIYQPESGQGYNIEQVALFATSGEVPSRVAARVQLDRGQVRSAVSAVAKADVNTISITGRSPQPVVAESLANVTAQELIAEIDGAIQAAYQAELNRLKAHVETAEKRLAAVSPKDAAGQASARAEVDAAQRALRQYQASLAPKPQLRTLEEAAAGAVAPAGLQAPDSKPVRAFLLGGIGFLLAVAGAIGVERFDRRIRSKSRAEEAFGAPVIAEVPPIPKSSHDKLLTITEPTSPFVEAYRGLRTYVALWAPESGHDDGHRVIVVTSPAPGEGKTTTVAHLAAMLAEIGRSVVVISADLRRPRLHQYFGRPEAPGLMDALTDPGGPTFDGLDEPTSVRGVRLVPSGPATENPAPMIEHAGDLLQAVRGLADFVLVDSPPLLVASDSVELARHADGVLLVARAGQTTLDAAEHCSELLDRLEIPVVGAVLVGSDTRSSASRYYAARYYAEPDRSGRARPKAPQEASAPGH